MMAQSAAIAEWGQVPGERLLSSIHHSADLVVNENNDFIGSCGVTLVAPTDTKVSTTPSSNGFANGNEPTTNDQNRWHVS
jgi:hypothetical protein